MAHEFDLSGDEFLELIEAFDEQVANEEKSIKVRNLIF